jgi:hypothetical protein
MNTSRAIALVGSDIELGDAAWEHGGIPPDLSVYEKALFGIGEKYNPKVCEFGQYHGDNIFAEMAQPPAEDTGDFLAKYTALKTHLEMVMGMELRGYDYIDIPEGVLSRTSHPYLYDVSRTFGCSPDLQGGIERMVPRAIKRRPLREAGLHLHMQLPLGMMESVYEATDKYGNTLLMDRGTYIQGLVVEFAEATRHMHQWNHPSEMPWYRSPGCYRIKEYGIEYRSLGAGLLNNTDSLAHLVDTTFDFLADVWRRQ